MSPSLVIEASAAELGMSNATAALLSAQEPFDVNQLLEAELAAAVRTAAGQRPDRTSYRSVLEQLGYHGVEPAGEKLVRLAGERGLRSYGLLVDACNVVALRHAAGIGLHDVGSRLQGNDVVALRTRGDERIVPAFQSSARSVPPGDLVYGIRSANGFEPLAWLGKRDTDAASGQIRDSTTTALIVVLGHRDLTSQQTRAMCEEVAALVRQHRPETTMTLLPTVVTSDLPN